MTWEIVSGLIVLVGFLITVGKVVANNTKAMTEIKVTLDDLKEALQENKKDVKELQETVVTHETRITVLENEIK